MFLDRVIRLGENLYDQENCCSPKKLISMIGAPSVAHLNIEVPSFKMILISAPLRVPRPSYPFREKFGRSGKRLFGEKAKTVDRGSLWSVLECAGS